MNVFKGGWHPDKAAGGGKGMGKSTSARGDFKGLNQLAGMMGKGKDTQKEWEAGIEHHSAPLSTLRDPAEFGPPPKHIGAYGPQAATAPSSSRTTASPPTPTASRGLGAPIPRPQPKPMYEESVEEEQPVIPSGPYRADTTGLETASLPKPPSHAAHTQYGVEPSPAVAASRPMPKLPPRLPPRQNSQPNVYTPEPPPAYSETSSVANESSGYLNQAAAARLGNAGVSVPGLGVGNQAPPASTRSPTSPLGHGGQMNELQARFASMGRKTSETADTAKPAPSGTSWAQKQSALQTASNFRKDPSSISLAEARSAASTANNFRERHGEQVAAGWKGANDLNQRYGMGNRLPGVGAEAAGQTQGIIGGGGLANAASAKAKPPPPPKKKSLQSGNGNDTAGAFDQAAPPIPHASKPR